MVPAKSTYIESYLSISATRVCHYRYTGAVHQSHLACRSASASAATGSLVLLVLAREPPVCGSPVN